MLGGASGAAPCARFALSVTMPTMANTDKAGPRKRRVRHHHCIVCGVMGTRDAPISSRGKCYPCGIRALQMNIRQQKSKLGPYYQKWVEGMIGAIEDATGGDVEVIFKRPGSPYRGVRSAGLCIATRVLRVLLPGRQAGRPYQGSEDPCQCEQRPRTRPASG